MLLVVFASGLGLLVLPGATRAVGRRLHPSEWSRLCLAATVGGAALVESAAILYALPTLAASSRIPVLAELCRRMLGPLAPGGPTAGWTAAAVAVSLAALAARGYVSARASSRRMRIERCVGRHRRFGHHHLAVLPIGHPIAMSVPPATHGRDDGQIVISDGLADALTRRELDAVLHHEAAHLRHGHHRDLTLAAMVDRAFAWFPPARRGTATLRIALERWADEDAAGAIGDRQAVHRALVTVTARLVADPAAAAFSAAETIGERLDALEGNAPSPHLAPHLLLYCPGVALGALAAAALASWATGATAVVAMAGPCS